MTKTLALLAALGVAVAAPAFAADMATNTTTSTVSTSAAGKDAPIKDVGAVKDGDKMAPTAVGKDGEASIKSVKTNTVVKTTNSEMK